MHFESLSSLIKFWAKASDIKRNEFQPLICHMIDVANVGSLLCREVLAAGVCEKLAASFHPHTVSPNLSYLAGLHDLGKCSPPFTLRGHNGSDRKSADLLALFRGTGFWRESVPPARLAPHGHVSAAEVPRILAKVGCSRPFARQIGLAIGAHHGVFPDANDELRAESARYSGGRVWADARTQLAETLADLLGAGDFTIPEAASLDNASLMILAGLVTVANWIGSDTRSFPCAEVNGDYGTPRLLHDSLED